MKQMKQLKLLAMMLYIKNKMTKQELNEKRTQKSLDRLLETIRLFLYSVALPSRILIETYCAFSGDYNCRDCVRLYKYNLKYNKMTKEQIK